MGRLQAITFVAHADLRIRLPRLRPRIRTADSHRRHAACPSCKGQDLERLLSHVSISSENTRQLNFNKARAKAKLVQRDKDVAQAEYEKKHREEGH